MTAAQRLTLIAAAMLATACSGGDNGVEPGGGGGGSDGVASVLVSPGERQLFPGDDFTASATVRDAQGRPLSGRTVTWSSSNDGVATVSQSGVVTAVAPGTAQVKATSEGRWNSATVTVVQSAVARVDLDIATVNFEEGATRQLVATPKNAAGQPLAGRGMTWTSTDATIAHVNPLGLLTAVRAGAATITVRVEGKTATANVIVSADYDYNLMYDGWSGVAGVAPELYQLDVRHPGGMPARVFPGVAASDATPSPDGSKVAYVVHTPDGNYDIVVASVSGGVVTRLTNSVHDDDQPAWSPDGTQIAFRRWDFTPGTGHSDVWLMNADGGNQRSLTADQGRTNQTHPAWSPLIGGGYRITYSSQSNDVNGQAHIWTMAADGTDKRQITTGDVFDDEPAWSPDGATIAYGRSASAVFGDIYLVNAAGGNVRRLLLGDLSFGQFAPAWSPDGRMIAFSSKHETSPTYQIYTAWADGSKLTRRTFDETSKSRPSWITRTP